MDLHNKRVFFDFFAGCGGLSLGLEEAGFHPVFVNELNPDAMKTYLANRVRSHPHLAEFQSSDIKDLVKDKGKRLKAIQAALMSGHGVKEIDLVVGGPPCQGYSGIGHRRSYSVDREQLPSNHLYEDYAFVISRLKPKIFLFENVRGLLFARWSAGGHKGEIWDDVKSVLRSIPGYSTSWALVSAKDYGVPQNRPRVLFVGIRNDLGLTASDPDDAIKSGFLPEGRGNAPDPVTVLSDLVDEEYGKTFVTNFYPSKANNPIQRRLRRAPESGAIARKGDPVTEQEYSKHSAQIRAKFAHMLKHDGQIPEEFKTKKFAQRVLPREWDEAGPSITVTSLADDYVHYEQPRSLTVREWARLQCFPDWYKFCGKRTTGGIRRAGNPRAGIFDREVPKYTQIGNAVPVWLAQAVGEHFMGLL